VFRGVHGGELIGYMTGGLVGCWRVVRELSGLTKRELSCWVRSMEDGGRVVGCKCRVED
jgi:hypothetical protein